MEIEKDKSTPLEEAKKCVERTIKEEFDDQQRPGFQYLFSEEWRENCIARLLTLVAEVKKCLFAKLQAAPNVEAPPESNKMVFKDDLQNELRECVTGCWMKLRHRKNIRTQTILAQQLIYLASDKRFLGDYAFNIKLQYFNGRQLVVKFGRENDMGLDNAVKLRDYCVFERMNDFRRIHKNNDGLKREGRELEYAAIFAIILLWEGIGYEHIKNLFGISFDCSEGRNLVFLVAGDTYVPYTLSLDAWAILSRIARSMPSFFRSKKAARTKTLGDIYPNLEHRVRNILKTGGKRLNMPEELCEKEPFRQMALLYKLLAYNCKPAFLSDVATAERSKNVLSPSAFYPEYAPRQKEFKPQLKTTVKEVIEKDFENDESIIYLEKYFSDIKENIDKSIAIAHDYTKHKDRERALREVGEHLKMQPASRMTGFTKYLVETRSIKGKKLVPSTILGYLRSIAELFIFRIVHGAEKIYDDELISIVVACNTSDGKPLINKDTLDGFKSAYWNYERYLKKNGEKMPIVRWVRLRKYCDKSRRLIVIPSEEQVTALIKGLQRSKDEYTFNLGMILAMEYYLGLRSKEAFSFDCTRFRCIGEGEYYIEVMGKFSKERRVDLSLMPFEYRELLVWMVENAISNGRTELFGWSNREKYKYRFEKLCKEHIPSGMHSLRHSFVVEQLLAGMDPWRLASILGHETLRVLHNTYDQSAYFVMKNQMKSYRWEKELISRDEAMGLLRLNEKAFMKFLAGNKISPVCKENAYRRGGEKVNYYDYDRFIDVFFKDMARRTSRISLISREVLWKNSSLKRKRMSAEQKRYYWTSLKPEVSLKQGCPEETANRR